MFRFAIYIRTNEGIHRSDSFVPRIVGGGAHMSVSFKPDHL